MLITAGSLDDMLREVLEQLLNVPTKVTASRGDFRELFGPVLHLTNPRARLSRSEKKGKLFSALGELFWYLSGATRLDFIDYYVPGRFKVESDDGVSVRSGYGERLFSHRGVNQVRNVIDLLSKKKTSRRAVIQLFDASDLSEAYKSIPCTCTLQFLIRDDRLSLFVAMRSNDAYIGLPHDVFAFTMLQELIARSIGVEVGEYKHCAGSLHLYDEHEAAARSYLDEAWQSTIAMPSMPAGEPWSAVRALQSVEEDLRKGGVVDVDGLALPDYWKDLARLLRAYRASRSKDAATMQSMSDALTTDVYQVFLRARLDNLGEQPALETERSQRREGK